MCASILPQLPLLRERPMAAYIILHHIIGPLISGKKRLHKPSTSHEDFSVTETLVTAIRHETED